MAPFWKTKPLSKMTRREWESLCDGCAKCCLVKLVDDDLPEGEEPGDEDTHYTNLACRLLDRTTCQCTRYKERMRLVPDCVRLTPESLPRVHGWLPRTCAYRLLHEGADLPFWHPLVSGERESVHRAGVSLKGEMLCESDADPDFLEDYIIPKARVDADIS